MKYRVERVLTDHGHGLGWVVLNPDGKALQCFDTWRLAFRAALVWAGLSASR